MKHEGGRWGKYRPASGEWTGRKAVRCQPSVSLNCLELETRDVLSPPNGINYNWPVPVPAGTMPDLLSVYGNFSGRVGLHFHEGVDDVAAAGTEVKAIDGRTVFSVDAAAAVVPNRHISVNRSNATSTPEGWNYIHTQPGLNSNGNPFAVGNAVNANDVLGTVTVAPAGWPAHIHLEYGTGPDPWAPFLRTTNDPLMHLKNYDTIQPTVDKITFRLGEDDESGALTPGILRPSGNRVLQSETLSLAHRYFFKVEQNTTRIIVGARAMSADGNVPQGLFAGSSKIDIIASAYDRVKA